MRFRSIFAAAVLFVPSQGLRAEEPHVLMISLDGMKPEYVTEANQHGLTLPVLNRFLSEGTFAEGVTGVVPTVTYPSHTTLVTGVSPSIHGIYSNIRFNPWLRNSEEWYWYFKEIKTETLYQAADHAGLKTAAVSWPVTVGAPIDYLIAEYGQSEMPSTPDGDLIQPPTLKQKIGVTVPASATTDESDTLWAIGIINNYDPNFVLVHLSQLDHVEHEHSPFSAEAKAAMKTLDGQVGRLMEAELSRAPDAKVVIVSDHGFMAIDRMLELNVLFVRAGLIRLKQGPLTKGISPIESWDAQAWNHGGLFAIVVRDEADASVLSKVKTLLTEAQSDPRYGISKVLSHDEVVKMGGFPAASFVVDLKPGWGAGPAFVGEVVRETPGRGTHGFLPDHPEMRSTFMVMGKGVAHGRNLGVIDMRQIAPTVAQMLTVKLPAAEMQPVKYQP